MSSVHNCICKNKCKPQAKICISSGFVNGRRGNNRSHPKNFTELAEQFDRTY